MWLLPVGTDHGSCGAAPDHAQTYGCRHRHGYDQCLSLRHLSTHSRRGASRRGLQRQSGLRRRLMTIQRTTTNVSRRHFLFSSAIAGGGLALGLYAPWPRNALAQTPLAADGSEVGAWVFIRPNDDVVIRIARSERGQGTLPGLAKLVAKELECDWRKVKAEYPTPGQNLARRRIWATCPRAEVAVFAARKSMFARAAP